MKQKQRGHSPATCWLHLAGHKSTALAAHLGIRNQDGEVIDIIG